MKEEDLEIGLHVRFDNSRYVIEGSVTRVERSERWFDMIIQKTSSDFVFPLGRHQGIHFAHLNQVNPVIRKINLFD